MSKPSGLFSIAIEDANTARLLRSEKDTPFSRRVYVRTAFASIDAILYEIQKMCFPPELREKIAKMNRWQRIQTTLKEYNRYQTGKPLSMGPVQWSRMTPSKVMQLVDRLQAPKKTKDYNISDSELEAALTSESYIITTIKLITIHDFVAKSDQHLQKFPLDPRNDSFETLLEKTAAEMLIEMGETVSLITP